MGKKIEYKTEKDLSISQAVLLAVPTLTHAKADKLIKSGEVRVNGERIRMNAPLVAGDMLTIFVPDSFDAAKLKVVYDDDNIVVFDKPKHVAFDAIPDMYGAPLTAVHRLDTNTTGLICFAKTKDAELQLISAFKKRNVSKRYAALVYPAPEKDRASLTAYLLVKDGFAVVYDAPVPRSEIIMTQYEVIKRMGGAALVHVYPRTGRTHQIRAHLAHIGCPIVGDPKYGTDDKLDGAPSTQMLACTGISFNGLRGELAGLNGKMFKTESGFDLGFLTNGKTEK